MNRKTLPTLLIVSNLASGQSTLEPAETVSVRRGGSFWCLLTESTPADPLLSKNCHVNQIQYYGGKKVDTRDGKVPNPSPLKSNCSNKGKENATQNAISPMTVNFICNLLYV